MTTTSPYATAHGHQINLFTHALSRYKRDSMHLRGLVGYELVDQIFIKVSFVTGIFLKKVVDIIWVVGVLFKDDSISDWLAPFFLRIFV